MPSATTVAAFAAGLLLTLCLAAWLTPRAWWRRANARALAVLVCGTALLGGLLHVLVAPPSQAAQAAQAAPAIADVPLAGARYRAWDHVNLRAGTGVAARRLAVVPAGSHLTASGRREGDWWQVSAVVDGRRLEGWASSLWLRRADEAGSRR
ncbi:SH3 domain-containing protein [Massilia yuzhufengensis]|uniref:SH3 domain-containing protein n=1 Tax=Massilia yuzhufengensis TaxID=1164594 RepID=A0A1I1PNS1_9BURK|nr:SH3 domain-containing protein [Massilia yuzhufengensis]SFD11426.1 hypothetical protein SAMN05216204_11685 [Massilia yuzhufengensis]